MDARFRLHRTNDPRFPFQVTLEKADGVALRLLVQDRWPSKGRTIFCVRLGRELLPELEIEDELEDHRAAVTRIGRKLSIAVDRKSRRRSDLLFVKKDGREQIFWMAQGQSRERRPRAKLAPAGRTRDMVVAIDTRERYAWKLAGCTSERRALPCGDYALVDGDDVLAVVERKSLDNFLHDLCALPAFHQSLVDLAAIEHHALVVEAGYGDLLSPRKLGKVSPTFVARALAEIHAVHPRLRIVYAETRKLATEWSLRWFAAVWQRRQRDDGQLSFE